jgi:hypothetical protein
VRQTAAASFLWAARALPPSITQAAAERLDGDIRDLVYNSLNLREPTPTTRATQTRGCRSA